jgi:hypothetical protein
MTTVVKVYREPENESLIIDENALNAYNQLALELGLQTQENIDKGNVPNVYPCLNLAMKKQLYTLCSMNVAIESYKRTTIPLEVLEVYKFAKNHEMFEGFQIWYDDQAPDPMLIGWNYQDDESREKKYTWRKNHYLLARWGDSALEVPELLALGYEKIKTELLDQTKNVQRTLRDVLEDPDNYIRKILKDDSISISIKLKAQDTIY